MELIQTDLWNYLSFSQILCSPNLSAFKWLRVNDKDFAIQTMNKVLVKGGFEDNYILNIGRIAFQGETVLGKVVTNSVDYPGTAPMFYAFRNQENRATIYEVMIYEAQYLNILDLANIRNLQN